MNITLSKLTEKDSKDVVKLLINSFNNNYDKRINKNVFNDPSCLFLVAKDSQAVAGYASLHFVNKLNRKTGLIEDVAVGKEFRGMGIGKLIVNKLIELCKENECDKIILNSNEQYLNFYENLGFKKKDSQMVIKL